MPPYVDQQIELESLLRRAGTRVQSSFAWPAAALAILGFCGTVWFAIFELAARVF